MSRAWGYAIVRDGRGDAPAYYLQRDGTWAPDASDARPFATYRSARHWIRSRPAGYWLAGAIGRPRIVSARAAGVDA